METVIIEFNGLPGCGKSTTVDCVKKRLAEKVSTVIDDSVIYDSHSHKYKKFLYAVKGINLTGLHILAAFFPFYFRPGGFFVFSRAMKLFKLTATLRKFRKTGNVLIISEGFTQNISVIFDLLDINCVREKTLSKLYDSFKRIIPDIIYIDCICPVDVSVTRLAIRGDIESYTEKLLSRRNNTLNVLRRYENEESICLDMCRSSVELTFELTERLEKWFTKR